MQEAVLDTHEEMSSQMAILVAKLDRLLDGGGGGGGGGVSGGNFVDEVGKAVLEGSTKATEGIGRLRRTSFATNGGLKKRTKK